LHGLGDHDRTLIEVAALLHDIGKFINPNGHHKHSLYLIRWSTLIGLDDRDKAVAANVARYHRKSFPKVQHEPFAALSPEDRERTLKMAAILRLANALDAEHGARVETIGLEVGRSSVVLRLRTRNNAELECWALEQQAELFERVYGRRLQIVTGAS
jgi:exopolyphosphatase/guanosine-5'-triphosphate,3'-diphosphate pyrophosphatase